MNEALSDELEVLRSMYGDDFVEGEKIWNLPVVKITIRPLVFPKDEQFSLVVLQIKIPVKYPSVVPHIDIAQSKGLADAELQELKELMNNLAKERCVYNEVYLHDITSLCEKYLESHNRKPQTFYELMLNRQSNEKQALVDLKKDKYIIDDKPAVVTVIETEIEKDTPISTPAVAAASLPEESNEWLRNYINQDDITESNNTEDNAILQEASDSDDDDEDSDEDEFTYGHAAGIRRLSITNNYVSRYEQEFNELERLGKGASGEVWKVKNKLDKRFYAIKKIALDPWKNNKAENQFYNKKIKREVTTISRLLHKNIVRYFAAWLEEDNNNDNVTESVTDPTTTDNDLDAWSKSDLSVLIAPNATNDYDDDEEDDIFFSNPDKISNGLYIISLTHSLTHSLLLTHSLTHCRQL